MLKHLISGGYMAVISEKRCSISLVVNGNRWQDAGENLLSQQEITRAWTLGGLRDYVVLMVGAKLGFTMENCDLVDVRWCRAKAIAVDGEAVTAEFKVLTTPHVTLDDVGAGLALEAVEAAAQSGCKVVVMVGGQMNWMPLRLKLEAAGVKLYELLLTASGKVVVSTDHVIDLRELARRHQAESPVSALFKPVPIVIDDTASAGNSVAAMPDASFAGNALRGNVKSLANGYGMITRRDGLGDVQFMATQVRAPGFDFIELGDELRFDVVQVSPGKWLAQRVVRL